MLFAIFIGYPISFTLIFLGFVFGYIGFGDLVFYLMTFQFSSVMLEQTLAAVPLFIFMGILMEQAGLMERLFLAVQLMLSRVRGALFIAVLFVSTIFAAATGIVGASVTILGIMSAKTMNRSGYDVRLAAGTITAGGTLGILIPPSIMLVVMGPILEVPVTDLFAAAVVPGFLLAFMYTGYALIRCYLNPALGPVLPPEDRADSMGHIFAEFCKGLIPPAALVFSALGSILFGLATPTEGAGMGAAGALLLTPCLPAIDLAKTSGRSGQDPRDLHADFISGSGVEFLRRGLLAARYPDDAHGVSHGDGSSAHDDPVPDHGADLSARLAAGNGCPSSSSSCRYCCRWSTSSVSI